MSDYIADGELHHLDNGISYVMEFFDHDLSNEELSDKICDYSCKARPFMDDDHRNKNIIYRPTEKMCGGLTRRSSLCLKFLRRSGVQPIGYCKLHNMHLVYKEPHDELKKSDKYKKAVELVNTYE